VRELDEIEQKILKALFGRKEPPKLGELNELVGGSPNSVIDARGRLERIGLVVVVESPQIPSKGAKICRLTLEGRRVAELLVEIDKIIGKRMKAEVAY